MKNIVSHISHISGEKDSIDFLPYTDKGHMLYLHVGHHHRRRYIYYTNYMSWTTVWFIPCIPHKYYRNVVRCKSGGKKSATLVYCVYDILYVYNTLAVQAYRTTPSSISVANYIMYDVGIETSASDINICLSPKINI